MMLAKKRFLCIDNNASGNLAVYLLGKGYEIKRANSLTEAAKLTGAERFDGLIINHGLVAGEVDSCEKLHKFARRSPILFYSSVTYPYEQFQQIHCREHHHEMTPVYVYDIVEHASRLLLKKDGAVVPISPEQFRSENRQTAGANLNLWE